MKKFLLTFVLVVALAGLSQAAVVYSDDFEGQTVGSKTDWYNPKGDVTVVADDGSIFGYPNQYVQITDAATTDISALREFLSPTVSGSLCTLSFDFYEPTDAAANSSLAIRLTDGTGTNWLHPESVVCSLDDGTVGASTATSVSGVYTLDTPHHVDIVVNLTSASGTYNGKTLPYQTYDVWVDYQLILSNVAFHETTASQIRGILFTTYTSGQQVMYLDNVQLRDDSYHPLVATNPVPASLETAVPLTSTLAWDAGIDTATGNYADVSEYHVYIGYPVTDISRLTDPNLLNDPNLTVASYTVAESGLNSGTLTPDFLSRDITYAWRVDEVLADANDTIVPGYNWAFTTVLSIPVVNTELPADAKVGIGEHAELTVDASNPFTGDATGLSYQWYYSADNVAYSPVGTNSLILAIDSAQATDQGYYYCDVTIVSNNETVSSGIAFLTVKQALAHWTMDQADFVGDQYLDIAGGHNADSNTAPIFVDGAGPDAPAAGAALIAPDSYGMVGSWNPLETTGKMTLSAWVKWDGTLASEIESGGKDILSKSSGWGVDVMMWNLKMRSVSATSGNAGIWLYNKSSYGLRSYGKIVPDTWTHVCVTYDAGQVDFYRNGQYIQSDTDFVMDTGTTSSLKVGGSSKFPGALDNVMIHNYAMDAEDVATLYYQTSKESTCLHPPVIDFNNDCKTDILDLAILAQNWLECGKVPAEACGL